MVKVHLFSYKNIKSWFTKAGICPMKMKITITRGVRKSKFEEKVIRVVDFITDMMHTLNNVDSILNRTVQIIRGFLDTSHGFKLTAAHITPVRKEL